MIWRRYRSTAGWALLGSAAIGILCGLAVYLGANPDYRAQSGWGGFAYWISLGAILGGGTGLAAILGGAVAIVLRDRDLSRESRSRILLGVAGASIGPVLLWGAFGTIATATGGADYLYIFIGIAAAAVVVTAVLAGVMLSRAERRQDGDTVRFRANG